MHHIISYSKKKRFFIRPVHCGLIIVVPLVDRVKRQESALTVSNLQHNNSGYFMSGHPALKLVSEDRSTGNY